MKREKGPKKIYTGERDSLEGPHEEAEIQRKALRRGKNLAFSEDTCLEKERVRSKVTLRKVLVHWVYNTPHGVTKSCEGGLVLKINLERVEFFKKVLTSNAKKSYFQKTRFLGQLKKSSL